MESFVSYWQPPQIILDYQDVPRKWSCDTVPVPFKKDYTFKEKCYYTFNFASEYFFQGMFLKIANLLLFEVIKK